MAKRIPYAPESELAVIANMVYWPDLRGELLALVAVEDFHDQTCAAAFAYIEAAHWSGTPLDEGTLVSHLAEQGRPVDVAWRADLMAASNDATYRQHAATMVRYHARRQLQDALADATSKLEDLKLDPSDIRDDLRRRLGRVDEPGDQIPADCTSLDELLALDVDKIDPWVIPGLLRRGWRLIVVAGEGAGKSTLLRQIALCAAAGIHPLDLTGIEPVRTLLVELETPATSINRALRWSSSLVDLDRSMVRVWARQPGLDIRTRNDRRHFESILAQHRPQVVCVGPLYKLFRRRPGESDEDVAAYVQPILDDLVGRYGLALVIEHHAPHGTPGNRDMRPFGSARWQWWPDLGFGLVRERKDQWHPLVVTRFRGDRVENQWPRKLGKGTTVPWVAQTDRADDSQGRF